MPELREEIGDLISASGANAVAVVYRDASNDVRVAIAPDRPFHPASLFKICVLMEAQRQARRGPFGLDHTIVVHNRFRSIADGSPFSLRAEDDAETRLYERLGEAVAVPELLELMIVRSSNLATNLLIERLTAAAVTGFMRRLGAPGLEVLRGPEDNVAYSRGLNNVGTASGFAEILARLVRGTVVSPSASRQMLDVLGRQEFNEGIPAGLPEGAASVAHKTGWNDGLYHDAAVVRPNVGEPYVLVVLTQGLDEATTAPRLVRAISAAVFASRAAA